MAKARIQYKKVSLHASNQSVSVPVSYLDCAKLRSIANERGVGIHELLRSCVKQLIDEHHRFKAEIVKF